MLHELGECIKTCISCPLHTTRKNAVVGRGTGKNGLIIIGEAPGETEDIKGEPFVGRSGAKLTDALVAAKIIPAECYITNIVKCRPPQNRNPLPLELTTCSPYLNTEIAILKPKVICTLGKFSSQYLLKSEIPITKLVGKEHKMNGMIVFPVFHPSYILRNPALEKIFFQHIAALKSLLERN